MKDKGWELGKLTDPKAKDFPKFCQTIPNSAMSKI